MEGSVHSQRNLMQKYFSPVKFSLRETMHVDSENISD